MVISSVFSFGKKDKAYIGKRLSEMLEVTVVDILRYDELMEIDYYKYEKVFKNKNIEVYSTEIIIDKKLRKIVLENEVFERSRVYVVDNFIYSYPCLTNTFNIYSADDGHFIRSVEAVLERRGFFYWKERKAIVRDKYQNGSYYFLLYDAETFELLEPWVPTLQDKVNEIFITDVDGWVSYDETKIITANGIKCKWNIMLYDVFTQKAEVLVNLEPVIFSMKNKPTRIRKLSEDTKFFVFGDKDSNGFYYFLCTYDLNQH